MSISKDEVITKRGVVLAGDLYNLQVGNEEEDFD